MAGIEVKKQDCQKVSGSPAQIWQALSALDDLIFGSIAAASEYGEMCLDLNDRAACSDECPERCGFECRAAKCARHNTPRTPHTTQD